MRCSATECSKTAGSVSSQPKRINIHEVECVDDQEGQGDNIKNKGKSMIQSISGGKGFPRFKLIQHKMHSSLPLNIFTFFISIFQFCPNIVEIAK